MTVTEMIVHRCASCGAGRAKPALPRIPKGWKRREQLLYCPTCWRKQYLLRAVAIPIVSPLDATWKEIDAELRRMWGATTGCANWMLTELYVRDVKRNGHAKLPPMPRTYLYPEARSKFPDLPSQTVAALEQAITAKYRAKRYDLLWTGRATLPVYRYPTPFPVHNQSWSVEIEKAVIVLSVRLGDRRYRLRLKSGAQFRRQRHSVEQMVAGTAITGECAIYKRGAATMAKLVAWLPRPAATDQEKTGTLVVRTEKDSMLVAYNVKDERLWIYNADHVRRWAAEHRRQLQRWSEDQKAESRPVPHFAPRRQLATQKYHARLDSACHQIAAFLAGYAGRRRFNAVSYNDAEHSFCPQFPYSRLRQLIEEKLDAQKIDLLIVKPAASAEVTPKPPEPLAEGEEHGES